MKDILKRPASKLEAPRHWSFASTLTRTVMLEVVAERERSNKIQILHVKCLHIIYFIGNDFTLGLLVIATVPWKDLRKTKLL